MKSSLRALTLAIGALAVSGAANAAIITSSLGNTASGFADGSAPILVTQIIPAQSGQPAPFDAGLGSDVFANAAGSWTHAFGAITDPIISAMLSLGLVDHDSAASGDQVGLFTVDGTDFTATLNTAFNGSGGGNGEYNEYSVDLTSIAASLLDGSADVVLNLAGPGLEASCFIGGALSIDCLIGNVPPVINETGFNGAHYIFATLTIETQDPNGGGGGGGGGSVPEPASLALTGLGLAALGLRRRRRG